MHNQLKKQKKLVQVKISCWFPKARYTMVRLINLANISSTEINKHLEHVLFGSGANCCNTNCKEEVVGKFCECTDNQLVDGIGKGLQIRGEGKEALTFKADN